jgi:hypothetical protein
VDKATAAVGSSAFFLLIPCVVAGLVPWWLTGWRATQPLPAFAALRALGVILIAAGIVVLVHAFVRFGAPISLAA